jgi:hypothetical protein
MFEGKRPWAGEADFSAMWKSQCFLDFGVATLANWFCWVRFNHWLVVPSVRHMPWPGDRPTAVVRVGDGSYVVRVPRPKWATSAWDEAFAAVEEGLPYRVPCRNLGTAGLAFKVNFRTAVYDLLWSDVKGRLGIP